MQNKIKLCVVEYKAVRREKKRNQITAIAIYHLPSLFISFNHTQQNKKERKKRETKRKQNARSLIDFLFCKKLFCSFLVICVDASTRTCARSTFAKGKLAHTVWHMRWERRRHRISKPYADRETNTHSESAMNQHAQTKQNKTKEFEAWKKTHPNAMQQNRKKQ